MTNNIPLERALMQLDEIRAHVETFECMPKPLRKDTREIMDLLEGRLWHYSHSQKAIDDIVAERGDRDA
tara:strand:+ start:2377 stop:2583 length:207 start_codon:yes stop_codon:yes gene_type:complete